MSGHKSKRQKLKNDYPIRKKDKIVKPPILEGLN